MIKACTCKHEGQDALHGKGQRVWNRTENNQHDRRCTVCGKTALDGVKKGKK